MLIYTFYQNICNSLKHGVKGFKNFSHIKRNKTPVCEPVFFVSFIQKHYSNLCKEQNTSISTEEAAILYIKNSFSCIKFNQQGLLIVFFQFLSISHKAL